MNPKIYLIHASEDKERFVLKFAEKLRENGIDVWLDKWEMKVGDKLIDKMFDEGIKNAAAFLIVLSNNSVLKKWVKEELDAALVKRINEGSKILPIIIEECEIPEALKATLWIKVKNINSYEDELKEILSSILGQYEKPKLGELPEYTKEDVLLSSELHKIDNIILRLLCDKAMQLNDFHIHPHILKEDILKYNISETQFRESLDILDRKYYIKGTKAQGGLMVILEISTFAFDKYINNILPDYNIILNNVISLIVNKNVNNNENIIKELNVNKIVVNHILNVLELKNYVKLTRAQGNFIFIFNISPELKRILNK